jgi:biotin transport system substrate-specific component
VKTTADQKHSFTIRDFVLCALFCALIAVGVFLRIPLPLVPFTLQLPFVCLAGLLLGPRRGALSAFLYVFIGLAGLPVFTQGGGLGYVLQPTFGYLLGFVGAAALTGAVAKRGIPSNTRLFLASLAGILVTYAVGIAYYVLLAATVLHIPLDPKKIAVVFFLNTIGGDLLSAALIVPAVKRLKKAIPQLSA